MAVSIGSVIAAKPHPGGFNQAVLKFLDHYGDGYAIDRHSLGRADLLGTDGIVHRSCSSRKPGASARDGNENSKGAGNENLR